MCSKKNSTPSVFTENASSCQNMELVEHVALVQTFPSPSSPCLTYADLENIQTRHCSKLKKAVATISNCSNSEGRNNVVIWRSNTLEQSG